MFKPEFKTNIFFFPVLILFILTAAAVYLSTITGCGGGGGGVPAANNSYTPRTLELSGTIDTAALNSAAAAGLNSVRAAVPINFASECEIKAFDINSNPIYGTDGYFAGNNFFMSLPLTEDYGRYLLITVRFKTGHEIYKRLLGRIPRYDDAPSLRINVGNLKLDGETTAKALLLLEDTSKIPDVEINDSNVKTRFEIEAETIINDADSSKVITPLKNAINTVIKIIKIDSPALRSAKINYLHNISSLLNSFVAVAKARETDGAVAAVITGPPAITLSGKEISASTGSADISEVVTGIKSTIKPAGIETPVISPPGGVFETGQSISISCATEGATIKYALHGNTPGDTYGIIYNGPFMIKESTTIKAIAIKNGYKNSNISEAFFSIVNSSISPLELYAINIGDQNGAVDYIYKNGAQPVKSYDINKPFFEIEFQRADGKEFILDDDHNRFLKLKLNLTRTKPGSVTTINYTYPAEDGWLLNSETDFNEDFSAPVISGKKIKFNYKTNAVRPAEDASYELKITGIQNISYTDSTGLKSPAFILKPGISGSYIIYTASHGVVAAPVFSPAGGNFADEIYISMSCATPNAIIHYTLDSSDPGIQNGMVFNGEPILIAVSTTVKAAAFKDGMNASNIARASYIIEKTAAPQLSPAPGIYSGPCQINISTRTPGASIYYTLDAGANPSSSSILYSGPFIITESKHIKAIAVRDGLKDSSITSGEYIINKTEPPEFNPPPGTYAGTQNITLFSKTPGSVIRYTLDGSTPGRLSEIYQGPINLLNYGTTEIKAIAYKTDMADSSVTAGLYCILERAAIPQFSPPPGTYDATQNITITSTTSGAAIYYTLDGSTPGRFSTKYNGPIEIKSSLKLSAVAVKDGMADSFPLSGDYKIEIPHTARPVIYPSSGTYGKAQQVNISCETPGASIYYTLDESAPSTSSIIYSGTFEVNQNSYIKAFAIKQGLIDSEVCESYIVINMPRPEVEKPQFTPMAGTYTGECQISISCATPGAAIYYTLDGSRPTSFKTLFKAPFTIKSNATLKAFATKSPAYSDSGITQAEYYIKAPPPQFSVAEGSYTDEQTLAITTSINGAAIYYTTDGSAPAANQQNIYNGPFTVSRSITVKAIVVKNGMLFSDIAQAQYVIKVKTPVFNPPAGNYTDTQSVTISCATANSSIYYTSGGEEPSAASTLYTMPLTVSSNTVIKAIAIKTGLENSETAVAIYVVQPRAAKPLLTPPGGVYNSARNVTINTITPGAVIKYTTDGSEPSASSPTYFTPVNVTTNCIIKATAIKAGMLDSQTASENYTIDTNLTETAAPQFSPPAGTYHQPQIVTISSESGASIYYTLDGSYPGINSIKYISGISINSSSLIRAVAIKSGMANSADSSASYIIKTAAPVFTPAAGTYDAPQNIVISSSTSGASIKYTIDQSEPSLTHGTLYSAPVTLGENTTLRAIAFKTGMAVSDISQAAYLLRVAAPVATPAGGTFEGPQNITLTCATQGAQIKYTIDGSEPSSTAGTIYNTPITISASTTLKFIAYKNNMRDSAVISNAYTIKTAAPVFTPIAGTYEGQRTISISCPTEGAIIYYTTDGSTPTINSAQYSAPFNINSSQTIKAFAQKNGLTESSVVSAAYTIKVPTPAFSPAPGIYQTAQSISITCAMPGAIIYYTTDGSTPTTQSTLYSSPVTVSVTTTIKAIAVKNGAQNSAITTAVYTIGIPAAAPEFNPPGGAYTGAQTITITSATNGASIHYTLDGTEPTASSILYSSPITISTNTTIKAIAIKNGMINSAITSASYSITIPQAAAPVFSPAGGAYTGAQTVTITSATNGASIYYTTNGTTPGASSTLYSSPINISTTTTLKAIAVKNAMADSTVSTAVYTINTAQQAAAPQFSPPAGTYTTIQNVSITSSTAGADIYYTIDNSTPDASSTKYSSPIPVAASITIKAIAIKAGMTNSTVSTAEYNITANTFSLTTTAFTKGGAIPAKYSGSGADVSPPFNWANAPVETKSFAMICSDDINNTPDNPQDDFIHWVIYNIPPAATGLTENITKTASVTAGILPSGTAAQGKNSFGNIGYNGPAPSSGTHTYNFAILALDQTPTLPAGLELMAFVMSINGKLISQTIYSGTYQAQTAAPPVFSPSSGTYISPQTVTITSTTSGASIYYTTDGSTPATTSSLYNSPITISTNTTLKAIAIKSGITNSAISEANIIINTLPAPSTADLDTDIIIPEFEIASGGVIDGTASSQEVYYFTGTKAESDIQLDDNLVKQNQNVKRYMRVAGTAQPLNSGYTDRYYHSVQFNVKNEADQYIGKYSLPVNSNNRFDGYIYFKETGNLRIYSYRTKNNYLYPHAPSYAPVNEGSSTLTFLVNNLEAINSSYEHLLPSKDVNCGNKYIRDYAKYITFGLSTDTEKAKKIYEFLVNGDTNGQFTYTYYYDIYPGYLDESYTPIFQPSHFIIRRKGVCNDFAELFAALCRSLGMNVKKKSGRDSSDNGHEWNLIYLDGKWNRLDATWANGNPSKYKTYAEFYPEFDAGKFTEEHDNTYTTDLIEEY